MTIRRNEGIGRQIEELIAQDLRGVVSLHPRRYPYDVETLSSLIEIKSCRIRTRGHKNRDGSVYMQTGRFAVLESSHKRLLEEALLKAKIPEYIFVVYAISGTLKIVAKKRLDHLKVTRILAKARAYRRQDGVKYRLFPHTSIFSQKRL